MPDRLGDRAWRIERPTGVSARSLVLRIKAWPGVVDAVVTEHHVAAYFMSPTPLDEHALALLSAPDVSDYVPREHRLAVIYDGEDLGEVARRAHLGEREVIEAHLAGHYEVAMMGFAPGFAYLTGLDPRLVMPRRETPRPRVPKASLAIGGPYTGIYPRESPGGWHLLGRSVGPPLFDAETGPLLALGDRVRFVGQP